MSNCSFIKVYMQTERGDWDNTVKITKYVILRNFNFEESHGFIRERDSQLSLRMTFYLLY